MKTSKIPLPEPDVIFDRNMASISSFTLFGGLLNRCTLSPLAEVLRATANFTDGNTYFDTVSHVDSNSTSINCVTSSQSLHLHLNGLLNCTFQQHSPHEVKHFIYHLLLLIRLATELMPQFKASPSLKAVA